MTICNMPMCGEEATHVFLYGCLNAHIKERWLCHPHLTVYQQVTPGVRCDNGTCREPYEETLICILQATP